MRQDQIIIVLLRKPRKNNDERLDPFWEFGSFGITSCHGKNLLNYRTAKSREGKRLAFAQGGKDEFRLVFLTPLIKIIQHEKICEAQWEPRKMPFRFEIAPLLINNKGESDIPSIKKEVESAKRPTWLGRFSSKFRTRCSPINQNIGDQIIRVYQERIKSGDKISLDYTEALPFLPNPICKNRKASYRKHRARAQGKPTFRFRKC